MQKIVNLHFFYNRGWEGGFKDAEKGRVAEVGGYSPFPAIWEETLYIFQLLKKFFFNLCIIFIKFISFFFSRFISSCSFYQQQGTRSLIWNTKNHCQCNWCIVQTTKLTSVCCLCSVALRSLSCHVSCCRTLSLFTAPCIWQDFVSDSHHWDFSCLRISVLRYFQCERWVQCLQSCSGNDQCTTKKDV